MDEYGRSGRKRRRESRRKTRYYKSLATERPGRKSTEVDGVIGQLGADHW